MLGNGTRAIELLMIFTMITGHVQKDSLASDDVYIDSNDHKASSMLENNLVKDDFEYLSSKELNAYQKALDDSNDHKPYASNLQYLNVPFVGCLSGCNQIIKQFGRPMKYKSRSEYREDLDGIEPTNYKQQSNVHLTDQIENTPEECRDRVSNCADYTALCSKKRVQPYCMKTCQFC
ncbi:hypothetical protein GJ496_011633 [Pomphorhynchus laevis]|nr:hypothetical protein GJ496_011633 [Pomphorhynchus laevis]